MKRPLVLIFDVNDTLLDLTPLSSLLAEEFGSPPPIGEWFAKLLHGSVVSNYTGNYRPFGTIGVEVLETLARRRRVDLSRLKAQSIVDSMLSLPPHSDVVPALQRLSDAGFRLSTLTNSSADAVAAQISNSGLAGFFETMVSVDEVRMFKPAPEVYRKAAERLRIDMDQGLLIAAHDWDIAGARAVGLQGAFLARAGAIWGIADPKPVLVASDLGALANLLAET